uniref:CocE/NonD family hydrolase n=1 Tax=Rhodococcus qingshengii TaxID=334542 RepID=UPI001C4DDB08|nr:CocE/NonD family hydrolase [Rhodococcus qingshengii]
MRDGTRIGFDVPVPTTDGTVLGADVFLPDTGTPSQVIMTMGPYGKGRRFQDETHTSRWHRLVDEHPEILAASPCEYMTYETVDPQLWTVAGYAVVRVDSRGTGTSPGHLEICSPQETADYYDAIEWTGTQPWSTGKVGLCGISYYAIDQW